MTRLAEKRCLPCTGAVPPMKGEILLSYLDQLGNDWNIHDEHHLEKEYKFPDFAQALAFVNRVGTVAEQEGHHPEIQFGWGHVKLCIWTHKIDGLTESDFILAAKADEQL